MAEDDLLVQIETDKVTIDVRYQQQTPGVVKEVLVKMDDTVQACSTVLWLFAPAHLPAYLAFFLAAAPWQSQTRWPCCLQVGQPVCVVEQGAEAAPAAEAPADDKPAEEKPKAEAKNVPAAEQKGDKPEAPPPPPPPKPKPKPEPSKAPAKARLTMGRSMFALSCAGLLLGRASTTVPAKAKA